MCILNVLFICDEWKSSKGGLSTANRVLAINAAKWSRGRLNVYCYVLYCDDKDREHAKRKGVTLIKAVPRPCLKPKEWLKFRPPEIPDLHVVIGHGRQFGPAAYFIKDCTDCKWVQFIHVFCEDLGKYKVTKSPTRDAIEENEEKQKTEIELCKASDKVVAVGPRLQSKYQASLPNVKVEVITPGILEEFSNDPTQPLDMVTTDVFSVFVFGRGTWEDLELKGYDIIGNAIASLGENFELKFVGSPPQQHKAIMDWFQNQSKMTTEQLTVRGYCNQDELKVFLNQAHVVALPSRTEGFGMIALEALSADVPVLVSSQSGIAKALGKVEGGNAVIVKGGTTEWAEKIQQLSKQTREVRLNNAMHLRENYQNTYPWSTECQRFERMIHDLVEKSDTNGMYVSI